METNLTLDKKTDFSKTFSEELEKKMIEESLNVRHVTFFQFTF